MLVQANDCILIDQLMAPPSYASKLLSIYSTGSQADATRRNTLHDGDMDSSELEARVTIDYATRTEIICSSQLLDCEREIIQYQK